MSPIAANFQRAPLSPENQALRTRLRAFLPALESKPGWYGSIYFERKASQTFSANLKQTNVADTIVQGVAFRIYDGATLHEQATDDLEEGALKRFVDGFVKRVAAYQPPGKVTLRPYHPPNWKTRLQGAQLDDEILTQLPAEIGATTPVHFGIRFEKDPGTLTAAAAFARLRKLIDDCKRGAVDVGMDPADLTFVTTRLAFAREESIFLDRESDLSQAIYRMALTVVTMSGADRTYLRLGGLGGLEVVEPPTDDIRALLHDLKALKQAERLHPGKYRVIFGPVVTGVLAHEAFGHSQEADTCARGRSKAWELHKTGERVGNDQATILNNPAIYRMGDAPYAAWGSYFFDEEGWLASEQVLLDRGYLKAPMTNLTSAIRLEIPRTANGKRESFANGVYTRQTNTYFSAGDQTLDQLMSQLGDGYLALHPAGGMEDPKGMGIQVGISYLEEVKGGKPTGRLFKGPAGGDIQMTGYTPDVLNSILAKSKIEAEKAGPDSAKHPWNDAGGCGKYHKEFVYAGCGGPYMLLDGVTLG